MSNPLHLNSVIGFTGDVTGGLLTHPVDQSVIYPLGSTVVVRSASNSSKNQDFLQGHTDKVSCLAISNSGRYLASGQSSYMGFKADIILWDLETRTLLHRMSLHKVKVQALDFSADEKYLASVGGQDDNSLILWSVDTGKALCGSPAANNSTQDVKFFKTTNNKLATGGNYNLKVWEYDVAANKLWPTDVQLGQLQRCVNSLAIDSDDAFMYCGTTSGDVLQINLHRKLLQSVGPLKHPIEMGVSVLKFASDRCLLVGGGDGSISVMGLDAVKTNPQKFPVLATTKASGPISSIVVGVRGRDQDMVFFVGTKQCEIFSITYHVMECKLETALLQTAHHDKICGLAFPFDYSAVFATCSLEEIRLWHLNDRRELLRINVPNLHCHCIEFSKDGCSLVSGWSDGRIRVFGPQTGKLLFMILDAHQGAVTSLAVTADLGRIISGGAEGAVRVWEITKTHQVLAASMKEHKGAVNCIKLKTSTDDECVSASNDGTSIIWDLVTFRRKTSLLANTFFKAVIYHPDESQLVTVGTDRKMTYWDACDGQAIRIIEASKTQQLDALAIDPSGQLMVSGGGDKLVKVWNYDEGSSYFTGRGHSGSITNIAITPDCSKIVSVGSEGAIMLWDVPEAVGQM